MKNILLKAIALLCSISLWLLIYTFYRYTETSEYYKTVLTVWSFFTTPLLAVVLFVLTAKKFQARTKTKDKKTENILYSFFYFPLFLWVVIIMTKLVEGMLTELLFPYPDFFSSNALKLREYSRKVGDLITKTISLFGLIVEIITQIIIHIKFWWKDELSIIFRYKLLFSLSFISILTIIMLIGVTI